MKVSGVALEINRIDNPEEGLYRHGTVDLIELDCPGMKTSNSERFKRKQDFLLTRLLKEV